MPEWPVAAIQGKVEDWVPLLMLQCFMDHLPCMLWLHTDLFGIPACAQAFSRSPPGCLTAVRRRQVLSLPCAHCPLVWSICIIFMSPNHFFCDSDLTHDFLLWACSSQPRSSTESTQAADRSVRLVRQVNLIYKKYRINVYGHGWLVKIDEAKPTAAVTQQHFFCLHNTKCCKNATHGHGLLVGETGQACPDIVYKS
jgi:hypothetical protein